MKKLFLSAYLIFTTLIIQAQSGVIDYTFLATPPNGLVYKTVEQPDGKILVGGSFTNYAGSGKNHLVRLNADGTIDASFNTAGSGPGNFVKDIELMADGRIIICGNFVTYNGANNYFVARLLADGSLDNTFNIPPNSINGAVHAVELHTGDKVLAAGEFFICNGHSEPHIARFNYDGSVDTTFITGTGFNSTVYDIKVLPDTSIMACGNFVWSDGNSAGNIAHLTADGAYIASFDSNPGLHGTGSTAYQMAIQSDGKVIVGGTFNYCDGQQITGITRLNTDGSRDLSFTPPFYPYAIIRAMAIQTDGKILVGGEFTSAMYNIGLSGPSRFIRLNSDGTIDTTLDPGVGVSSGFVNYIEVLSDDKILVSGNFTDFDSETLYKYIVRLYPDQQAATIGEEMFSAFTVYPNPAKRILQLKNPFQNQQQATLELFSVDGRKISSETIRFSSEIYTLTVDLPSGVYFLRLNNVENTYTAKFIIE